MNEQIQSLLTKGKNFVFIGGAGSGKSELAIHFAQLLVKNQSRPTHFFDLDMPKALFRSRDLAQELEEAGVNFHCEEQFMDAPTQVGGVSRLLRDPNVCTVLDVGGDYIGARMIGGYAPTLGRENTIIFYLLNPYRPWMEGIEHIDETLGKILGVSHIQLDQLYLVSNPNIGAFTSADTFLEGHRRIQEMIEPYRPIRFACADEALCGALAGQIDIPLFPLRLRFSSPWLGTDIAV